MYNIEFFAWETIGITPHNFIDSPKKVGFITKESTGPSAYHIQGLERIKLKEERVEMPDIFGRIVGGVPDPKFKPELWRFIQELELTARLKTADHAETVVKFAADIKTEKYGLSAQDYVKMFCEKLLHYLSKKENENGSSKACSSC
jgi:hypothetical protein